MLSSQRPLRLRDRWWWWMKFSSGLHYAFLVPFLVQRCKLRWYGDISCSSGLAKTILQETVKGGRRQDRQRKTTSEKWTGLEFSWLQRAVENWEKWRKLVVKSCVVPQWPSWLRDRWWWWWNSLQGCTMHLFCPLFGCLLDTFWCRGESDAFLRRLKMAKTRSGSFCIHFGLGWVVMHVKAEHSLTAGTFFSYLQARLLPHTFFAPLTQSF